MVLAPTCSALSLAQPPAVTPERHRMVGWIKGRGFAGLVGRKVKSSRKFSVMVRN